MARPTRYTPEIMETYMKSGDWEPRTWSSVWDRNARDYPSKEAIVDSKKRLTWVQAKQQIDRLAFGLLELGIKKDELIVFQLPNSVDTCLLRVACEKAGILCLPALRTLRHKEMEHILKYTEAVGIVIPWEFRDFDHFKMIQEIRGSMPLKHVFVVGDRVPEGTFSIEEMIRRPLEEKYPPDYLEKTRFQPTEVSWVALTSGTTGLPKFVEHLLCAFTATGKALAKQLRLSSNDVVAMLPAAAAGPNNAGYWAAPEAAAKIVIMERYETEEALSLIEKERVTVVCVVPAQLAMIVQHPNLGKYDLSSVRLWRCGGAPLPYQLGLEIEEKLQGVIVNEFGSVDSGTQVINSPDAPQEVRLLTVGKPLDGHKVKIADENGHELIKGEVGEIWLGGPVISSGYYRDPETTWQSWTKNGWFKTGDLGKLDDHDNLVVVGRKKDMIIRGGQNIYPVEIENILLTHPKVANVAIVGMADPIMGERACAYIVLKPGQMFTFEEMVSYLKSKDIVAYKFPERIEIIDELPVVGDKKIDKKLLRQQIAQKLKAEGNA